MKNRIYFIITTIAFVSIFIFFYTHEQSRKPFSLDIDAIKDQTDISGTFYRVKITNTGTKTLTDIEVI